MASSSSNRRIGSVHSYKGIVQECTGPCREDFVLIRHVMGDICKSTPLGREVGGIFHGVISTSNIQRGFTDIRPCNAKFES
jgi:hypothetical protein